MVGLIEERLSVIIERQLSDKYSCGSPVVEKINISEYKPGGAVNESKLCS
jgi:hypothetical protein